MSAPRPAPAPRQRRSTNEVRREILDAAASLFTEQGFDATTTREIARRAGVAEPLVFRHYGSKAGLLEAVVVEPLSDFVERFATQWQDDIRAHRKLETRVRDFVERLYDLLDANRDVVVNLLMAAEPPSDGDGLARPLDRLFGTFCEISRFAGYEGDAETHVRLTFGMVASAVLFHRWLWRSEQLSRDAVVDAITDFLLPTFRHPASPKRRSSR